VGKLGGEMAFQEDPETRTRRLRKETLAERVKGKED